MAAFLSGLMGALKGVGAGASRIGNGLLGAIDPALAGTPAGAAAKPGSGGLMPSTAELAMSDLGDFKFGPGLSVDGVRPDGGVGTGAAEPAKPGFFTRINKVDPATGMSTVDKWDRLGARLQDIDDGGSRAAAVDETATERLGKSKAQEMAAQIDQLFPDDPRMRFILKTNPEKATAALADVYKSQHEAATVGAGDSRVFGDPNRGGSVYMAPKYGEADGYSYRVGPDGFQWGDQRGPTHAEVETGRHNRRSEDLGYGNLGVSRGNLDVNRSRLAFDRDKEGRGLGAGGLGGMSTADLIAALRGAR